MLDISPCSHSPKHKLTVILGGKDRHTDLTTARSFVPGDVTSPLGWDASRCTVALEETQTPSLISRHTAGRSEMTKWWGTNMLDLENTSTKEAELRRVCERVLSPCNTASRWIQDKVTSPSLFQGTVSALRWCLCSPCCIRDKKDSPQHRSFDCGMLTSRRLKRGCYKVCHFLNNEENGVGAQEFYPRDSFSCPIRN